MNIIEKLNVWSAYRSSGLTSYWSNEISIDSMQRVCMFINPLFYQNFNKCEAICIFNIYINLKYCMMIISKLGICWRYHQIPLGRLRWTGLANSQTSPIIFGQTYDFSHSTYAHVKHNSGPGCSRPFAYRLSPTLHSSRRVRSCQFHHHRRKWSNNADYFRAFVGCNVWYYSSNA